MKIWGERGSPGKRWICLPAQKATGPTSALPSPGRGSNAPTELRGTATAKPKSEQAQARERAMPAGFGSARAVPGYVRQIGDGENLGRRPRVGSQNNRVVRAKRVENRPARLVAATSGP
jgi:hypothetical protein